MCTALSAAGDLHLLGAYEDGSVRLWDIRHGHPISTAKVHTEPIFAMGAVSLPTRPTDPGQRILCVSGGADSYIAHAQAVVGVVSSAERGDAAAELHSDLTEIGRTGLGGSGRRGINSVAVRDDGKITAAACWDGRVRLYANRRPRLLASLRYHAKPALCVAFAPAGRWLASASEDTRIALWDVYRDGPAAADAANATAAAPADGAAAANADA